MALVSNNSAKDSIAITPDDNTDLEVEVRAIRVGTGGTVIVDTPRSREIDGGDGSEKRTLNFTDGETRDVRALRVYEASTATDIEGLV